MADAYTYNVYFAYTKKYIAETMDATTLEVVASEHITSSSAAELKDYVPVVEWLDDTSSYTPIIVGGSQKYTASALVEAVASQLTNDSNFYRRTFQLKDSSNAIAVDIFTTEGHEAVEFDASTELEGNKSYTFYIKQFNIPTVKMVKKYYTTNNQGEIAIETNSGTDTLNIDINDSSTGSFVIGSSTTIQGAQYYPAYAKHNGFPDTIFGTQLPLFPTLFSQSDNNYHTNTNVSPFMRRLVHQIKENDILKYNISVIRDLDILNYLGRILSQGGSFTGCYDVVYYPLKQVPTSLTVMYKLSSLSSIDLGTYGGKKDVLNKFTEYTTTVASVMSSTKGVVAWPNTLQGLVEGATICMEGEAQTSANYIKQDSFTREWTMTLSVYPSQMLVSTKFDIGYAYDDFTDITVVLNADKSYGDYWTKSHSFTFTEEGETKTVVGYLTSLKINNSDYDITKLGSAVSFNSLVSYTGSGSSTVFSKSTAVAKYDDSISVKVNYYGNNLYKIGNKPDTYLYSSTTLKNNNTVITPVEKALINSDTLKIATDPTTLNGTLERALNWRGTDPSTQQEVVSYPEIASTMRIYYNDKDVTISSTSSSSVDISERSYPKSLRKGVQDIFYQFAEKGTNYLQTSVAKLLEEVEGGLELNLYGDVRNCKVHIPDTYYTNIRAVLYSSKYSINDSVGALFGDEDAWPCYYKTSCTIRDIANDIFAEQVFYYKKTDTQEYAPAVAVSLCNYLGATKGSYFHTSGSTITDITYDTFFQGYDEIRIKYMKGIEYVSVTMDPSDGTGVIITPDGNSESTSLKSHYENLTWKHHKTKQEKGEPYTTLFPKTFLQHTTWKHLQGVTPILITAVAETIDETYEDIQTKVAANGRQFNLNSLQHYGKDMTSNPPGFGFAELYDPDKERAASTQHMIKTIDLTGVIGTQCVFGHLCSSDKSGVKLSSLLTGSNANVPYLANTAPRRRGFFLAGVGGGGGGCGGRANQGWVASAGGGGASGGFGCWYVNLDLLMESLRKNNINISEDDLYIKSTGGQGGSAGQSWQQDIGSRTTGGASSTLNISIYYNDGSTDHTVLGFVFESSAGGYANETFWPDTPQGGRVHLSDSPSTHNATVTEVCALSGVPGSCGDTGWYNRESTNSLDNNMLSTRLTKLATEGSNYFGIALENAYYGVISETSLGLRPIQPSFDAKYGYYHYARPTLSINNHTNKRELLEGEKALMDENFKNNGWLGKTMDEIFPGKAYRVIDKATKDSKWREGGYGAPSVCGFPTASLPMNPPKNLSDDLDGKSWSENAPGRVSSSYATAYNQFYEKPLPGCGGSGAGAGHIYTVKNTKYICTEEPRQGGDGFWGIFC